MGTFGVLEMPGFVLVTAELPWRMNERRVSCIPAGTYRCQVVRSPRFGRVVAVLDVPGRSGILFHRGNLAGAVDLGLDSHSQGCVLLGMRYGLLRNREGRMQRAVLLSAPACDRLLAAAGPDPFELTITNPTTSP